MLNLRTDLNDSSVLAAIDDNLSSSYAGDMFANSDSYPTLSHVLSPSIPQQQPSAAAIQQSHPPSTVHCQATSDCHIPVTSAHHQPPGISTQQRLSLHAIGTVPHFCEWYGVIW